MANDILILPEEIDRLIVDYLSKEIDTDEMILLAEWVTASLENREQFLQHQEVWFAASIALKNEASRFDREEAYNEFRIRVDHALEISRNGKISRPTLVRKRHISVVLLKLVAGVALLLAFSYGSYRFGEENLQKRFADITIESPRGSRIKFQLPDGSSVFLNSESKAIYSQGFGVSERCIALEGEGYFEVAPDAQRPFTVVTPEINIKVLGTKFNFSNYKKDAEASVTLMEGRVSLSDPRSNTELIALEPNQKVIFDKETGIATLIKTESEQARAWTSGELSFDEERLDQIIQKLERSYNVHIQLADPDLAALRFYGTFGRMDMNIDDVLHALASTNRITIRKENNTYYVENSNP